MIEIVITTCIPEPYDVCVVMDWIDKVLKQARNKYPYAEFLYIKASDTIRSTLIGATEYRGIPVAEDDEEMIPSEIRLYLQLSDENDETQKSKED